MTFKNPVKNKIVTKGCAFLEKALAAIGGDK